MAFVNDIVSKLCFGISIILRRNLHFPRIYVTDFRSLIFYNIILLLFYKSEDTGRKYLVCWFIRSAADVSFYAGLPCRIMSAEWRYIRAIVYFWSPVTFIPCYLCILNYCYFWEPETTFDNNLLIYIQHVTPAGHRHLPYVVSKKRLREFCHYKTVTCIK